MRVQHVKQTGARYALSQVLVVTVTTKTSSLEVLVVVLIYM